jgi:hypothetical protein
MTLKSLALIVAATLTLAACNEEDAATGTEEGATTGTEEATGTEAETATETEEAVAECTAETAQAKMGELTTMLTELGTSDPAKLEQFSGRAAELQTQFADVSADPQAACDAVDALIAEMQ